MAAALLVVTLLGVSPAPVSATAAPSQPLAQAGGTPVIAEVPELAFDRFPDDAVLTEWVGGTRHPQRDSENSKMGGLPVLSTETDRLYLFYAVQVGGSERLGVLVRDADDPRRIVAGFLLPAEVEAGDLDGYDRGQLAHALDPAGKRIFMWIESSAAATAPFWERRVLTIDESKLEDGTKAGEPAGAFTVDQVALSTGQVTGSGGDLSGLGDPRSGAVNGFTNFQGLSFTHGKLYLVLGNNAEFGQSPGTSLVQLDPDTLEVEWQRFVRSCRNVFSARAKNDASGFVEVIRTDTDIWLPCSRSGTAVVARVALDTIREQNGEEIAFVGSGDPYAYAVDREALRIHLRVHTAVNPSLLTFDIREEAFVGQQAVGPDEVNSKMPWALDRSTGRVYVQDDGPFGLSLLDGRTSPVLPGLRFPQWTAPPTESRVEVLPRDPERGRLYLYDGISSFHQKIRVLEDLPPAIPPDKPDPDENTADVDEHTGETGAAYSSDASGYGLRTLLTGGAVGLVPANATEAPYNSPAKMEYTACQTSDREFRLARVESVRLTNSLDGANAIAATADPDTVQDVAQPSRCLTTNTFDKAFLQPTIDDAVNPVCQATGQLPPFVTGILEQYLGSALGAESPEEETDEEDELDLSDACDAARKAADHWGGRSWPFESVACTSEVDQDTTSPSFDAETFAQQVGDDPTSPSGEDPLDAALVGFEASVDCSEENVVKASSVAQPPQPGHVGLELPAGAPTITYGTAASSSTERLDPEKGMVTVVESMVRDVRLVHPEMTLDIAGVYARAETTAKGRPDTAGTEYHRVLWGVRAVAPDGQEFNCDLCADDELPQMVDGLNQILGDRAQARLPRPAGDLQAGTDGGYQSAIQLDEFQRVNNVIVNGDGLFEVAALELTFYNDSPDLGRQRQIFQFAGVKANSQYGIYCVGGGEVQGNRCVKPSFTGGGITVSLTDGTGDPLAGGQFSASGPGFGSCTTGADGRCSILGLTPGSYTVNQASAPDGYVAAPGLGIEVREDEIGDLAFVNLPAEGRIVITLADADSGAPLGGGGFEVYSDDGDGQLSPSDVRYASCTTDAAGACLLVRGSDGVAGNDVPLGSYLVAQVGAPQGYSPVPDVVPFTLDLAGQEATLPFTNGSSAAGTAVLSGGALPPQGFENAASTPSSSGGGVGSVLDAFGDLGQWLRRNPGEAVLFLSSLALFGAPFWASWRRRLLIEANQSSS